MDRCFSYVVAVVPDPSQTLYDAYEDDLPRVVFHCTKRGAIVAKLRRDPEQTASLEPERWEKTGRSGLGAYRAIGDNKSPRPIVYGVPEVLYGEEMLYRLESIEYSTTGGNCSVVADYDGQPLTPYRHSSTDKFDWHPTASHFSAPALSSLSWRKTNEGAEIGVDRARITLEDGLVVVRRELLLENHSVCVPPKVPELPSEVAGWQKAAQALYERLRCTSCSEAHYSA